MAVVLSAQATDIGVNRATKDLFKKADNAKKMVALGEAKIRDAVKTIGLYRNKAKNVFLLSQKITIRLFRPSAGDDGRAAGPARGRAQNSQCDE